MERKIPTDYELDELAEDFVCSTNDEELPIKEEDLTEECLRDFLNDRGYEFVEEQMSDLINYILSSSDAIYEQIRNDAISEFRESLNRVISDANNILSDEDLLKIMVVGQLIEILKQFDSDREVMIHTLQGENIEVNGYFIQKDIDDHSFYLTDLDVVPRI